MKKLTALLLGVVLTASLLTGCGSTPAAETPAAETEEPAAETPAAETEEPEAEAEEPAAEATGSYKVGITVQSLVNAYWAGVFGEVETLLKEKGWEYTIVDCNDNSQEQISQIENFISSECDLIMVHPSDPNAIEDVCKQAMDAGITVMSWDDILTNTTLNWVLNNEDLGKAIGGAAAEFIKANGFTADKKAEVLIIQYDKTPILLDRRNGIEAGLKEGADGLYEIVADCEGLEAGPAQTNVETVLQAHPNLRIVAGIGAGADVGANQALMSANPNGIPDDMGIFSADATLEQLEAIKDPAQASRVSVGFEGSNKKTAAAVVDIYQRLLDGETFPEHDVYRPILPISADNVDEYIADYK
ncbi:sugar ABC transporter substrate-binding protein [Lachnospiraceae bacterium ZAX-1]